ncbi:hypothetical protein RUND412_005626 [Rhizina undulata]
MSHNTSNIDVRSSDHAIAFSNAGGSSGQQMATPDRNNDASIHYELEMGYFVLQQSPSCKMTLAKSTSTLIERFEKLFSYAPKTIKQILRQKMSKKSQNKARRHETQLILRVYPQMYHPDMTLSNGWNIRYIFMPNPVLEPTIVDLSLFLRE